MDNHIKTLKESGYMFIAWSYLNYNNIWIYDLVNNGINFYEVSCGIYAPSWIYEASELWLNNKNYADMNIVEFILKCGGYTIPDDMVQAY